MGAPQLEILGGGGGSSPSSSKNTMFNIGKFKVTKPMFYIGGVAIMLLLVLFVRSRNAAQVQSGYTFYPDGTEMIDNGVDVEAKLQNYSNMMENTLQGALTQMGNDLNYAMNDMRQEQNLLATELRQEQTSIVSELKQSNLSLQSSLQSMLTTQLNALKKANEPVNASYPTGYDHSYNSSAPAYYNSVPSNNTPTSHTVSWNYENPAPIGSYQTSTNQQGYQEQMSSYLKEVNGTRQDLIVQGLTTGNWDNYNHFSAAQAPKDYSMNTQTGKLENSYEYYDNLEWVYRNAAFREEQAGDYEAAAISRREQQAAIDARNKAQKSNLVGGK